MRISAFNILGRDYLLYNLRSLLVCEDIILIIVPLIIIFRLSQIGYNPMIIKVIKDIQDTFFNYISLDLLYSGNNLPLNMAYFLLTKSH